MQRPSGGAPPPSPRGPSRGIPTAVLLPSPPAASPRLRSLPAQRPCGCPHGSRPSPCDGALAAGGGGATTLTCPPGSRAEPPRRGASSRAATPCRAKLPAGPRRRTEEEETPRRNRHIEPPARQPRRAARSPSAAQPGGAAVVLRRQRLPRLGRGSRSIPRAASRNVGLVWERLTQILNEKNEIIPPNSLIIIWLIWIANAKKSALTRRFETRVPPRFSRNARRFPSSPSVPPPAPDRI